METSTHKASDPQGEKIALLEGLVHCLDREHDILADLDLHELWAVVEEKNNLLGAIQSLPSEDSEEAPPEARVPAERDWGPAGITNPAQRITRLKEEIRERARENAAFIQDSLDFVDELVTLLVGPSGDTGTYRPHGGENRGQQGPIYRREV